MIFSDRPEPAVVTGTDGELYSALLVHIERRRQAARRRLDELARRRAALAPHERQLARESLRSQAAEIGSELARLRLAASLARALHHHTAKPKRADARPAARLRQP